MSLLTFKINEDFLKSRGLELRATGAMFMPYESENENHKCQFDEYANLHITSKKTGAKKTINMGSEILTEEDFI